MESKIKNLPLPKKNSMLTSIRLTSYLWDIGKQDRPRSDAASDLISLYCLLTKHSNKLLKFE